MVVFLHEPPLSPESPVEGSGNPGLVVGEGSEPELVGDPANPGSVGVPPTDVLPADGAGAVEATVGDPGAGAGIASALT